MKRSWQGDSSPGTSLSNYTSDSDDRKRLKYDGSRVSPSTIRTSFHVNFRPKSDTIDLATVDTDEILRHVTLFTVHDKAKRGEFQSEMKAVLSSDVLQLLQEFVPDDMEEFYNQKLDVEDEFSGSPHYYQLQSHQSKQRIKAEYFRLWKNYESTRSDNLDDIPSDVMDYLRFLFNTWCTMKIKDIHGKGILGIKTEHEMMKEMLDKVGVLAKCTIQHNGATCYELFDPIGQNVGIFWPDTVYSSNVDGEKDIQPRIVVEIHSDQSERNMNTDVVFPTPQEVPDCAHSMEPCASFATEGLDATKLEKGNNPIFEDILKFCPIEIGENETKRRTLCGHHLGQLLGCLQQTFSTINIRSLKNKTSFCMHGLYVVGKDVYFTKVETTKDYLQSSLDIRKFHLFENLSADFCISNWKLNIGLKKHFLVLAAFAHAYSRTLVNQI